VFAATVLWVLALTVMTIDKIIVVPDGFEGNISHLTNWSWNIATAFFALTLGFIVPAASASVCNVRCAGHVAAACFFPLNTLVWFVLAAVFYLLATDPEFITDLFEHMEPGIVMVLNDVFHVIPVIALMFYAFFHYHLIRVGVNRWCVAASRCGGRWGIALYTLYLTFGGALAVVLSYTFVLLLIGKTANDVYGSPFPLAWALLFLIGVGVLFSGVPLLCLALCQRITKPSPFPAYDEARAMLKTDEEIFGSRLPDIESTILRDLDVHATSAMYGELALRTGDTAAVGALPLSTSVVVVTKTKRKEPIYEW